MPRRVDTCVDTLFTGTRWMLLGVELPYTCGALPCLPPYTSLEAIAVTVHSPLSFTVYCIYLSPWEILMPTTLCGDLVVRIIEAGNLPLCFPI